MNVHKLGQTLRPSAETGKNFNIRPRCPKCSGLMMPETVLAKDGETLIVVSVGCVNCGERIFRNHQRRRPDATDRNAHKLAGRPVINGRGII